MIHEVARELQAALAAKGCPFVVLDGPEPTGTTTWGRERVVIGHDGKDKFAAPRSQTVNPKIRYVRTASYVLTVYAQSPKPGALPFEHRRRAEKALDSVLVALEAIANGRGNQFVPSAGGFITPEDLTDSERPAGAAYELSFTFDRGVADRTWAGAKRPELSLVGGSMKSTTKVSQHHGADDDNDDTTVPAAAETACGA